MHPFHPTRARDALVRLAPDHPFDAGLQQERTTLSWERTSFSMIVAGALIGRYAAKDGLYLVAPIGGLLAVFGAGILVWATYHYSDLHDCLRRGKSPASPRATRLMGTAAVGGSLVALALGISVVLGRWLG